MEILNRRECLELLRTEVFGRLGVVVDGRPEIFPVNYTLDIADAIVFQTAPGMKLAAAVNHNVVFEVDHSEQPKSGWSVVVHGVAHHTAVTSLKFAGRYPSSWVPDASNTMRITLTSVSGRRFPGPANG
jgi:nitroimidazol reductase NimA-like FMN-containing flavoprotein (pyridoxamine 5'-phosphate oxidase superfamily)